VPRVSQATSREIAPGVTAITSLVELSDPLSWVEREARGADPSSCYVIRSGDVATLIDTGLSAQAPSLLDRLEEVIGRETPLTIAFTRVEPDNLGNLIAIARRFDVVRLCSQSNVIPFDYLGPYSSEFPGVEIVNGLHAGDSIVLHGERSLEVVEPAVRTLPTMWYFDAETGTLFTSDFFGEARPGADGDGVDLETARRHVLAKFDWLAVADTTMPLGRLDRVVQNFDVKVLAPGHGLPVIGRDDVRRRFTVVREALRSAGQDRNIVLSSR
jgi:flavorubredoxin